MDFRIPTAPPATDHNEQHPNWSPDGRRLAFNGEARDGNYEDNDDQL